MRLPPLLARIKDLIDKRPKTVSGGQVAQASASRSRRKRLALPFTEPIVRLALDDAEVTRDLCEIATWSTRAVGAVGFLSNDPFQQAGGQVGSWSIAKTRDGTPDGPRTHPDILAIGREMATRLDGKELVLGGDRLQSPWRNALFHGDGYAEVEISADGLGSYTITKLVDRPTYQMFGCLGTREPYLLVTDAQSQKDALEIPWWKVVHLSHQGRVGHYGTSLFLAQVDRAWRPLKLALEHELDIIHAAGTAPWIHSFGPDTTEEEQENYRLRIEEERDVRILTDLFISNGGSVQRAASGDGAIAGILNAIEKYEVQMIPAGFPSYLFPGVQGGDAGKDLSAQPALAYARKIANARSLIGQQVRWVVALEIVLRKGYEFFQKEGQFEIEWPFWMVSGLESTQMQGGIAAQQTQARLDQMMSSLESRYQTMIDLDNTGKIIAEISNRLDYSPP